MNRRELLQGIALVSSATIAPAKFGALTGTANAAAAAADTSFSPSKVRDLARALAGKPYEPPDQKLPEPLKDLTYDQYRSIRFLPEHGLWRGENRGFEAQFFHRGFFYKDKVDIYEVFDGQAHPSPTAATTSRSATACLSGLRPISASPDFACTRRSIAKIITTKSASSSAPVIFAPWPKTRSTGSPRAASPSTPATPRAKSSRFSRRSG